MGFPIRQGLGLPNKKYIVVGCITCFSYNFCYCYSWLHELVRSYINLLTLFFFLKCQNCFKYVKLHEPNNNLFHDIV